MHVQYAAVKKKMVDKTLQMVISSLFLLQNKIIQLLFDSESEEEDDLSGVDAAGLVSMSVG